MKEKAMDFFEKINPYLTKVGNSPYLQAISGAMMGTLGVLLIGSIAVVLLVLPSSVSFLSFLQNYNGIFVKLNTLTIGSMALYVVVLISYLLVKKLDSSVDGISASVIALLSFLVVTPLGTTTDEVSAIPATWLGAQGVFSAIIVGLVAAKLFLVIKEKRLVIKMPDGVPPMVTYVFESLIPCIVIVLMFTVINAIFELTPYGSMHQFVYSVIQKPLQGLGGSIVAVIAIILIQQTLWFFGIHGGNVVMPVVQTLWMAMDVENLNALAAGLPLPHITGYAFYNIATWSGTSLGLVLLMLRAKSKQYREMGKVAILPILFGIGEPVVFGVPLVFNFKLAVPLITNSAILAGLTYILTKVGIVARCAGITTIFGLPLGMYAAIEGSLSIIIMHLVSQLIIGPLLWYPWFKRLDRETYERECMEG
ncbi:PTS sugar transporter [Enterocloster clostridioformis]|uniref:PTS sugar transporter subunit IIC n=1 Tax=Enterocloster clostridioformis TaxID=1531 RepID=UPI00080CBAE5|nr:PTS transporter subunit EIIC [Enterocloster clostridioformis]ANU45158.1 PTS sugar transporter [Lachnoclostridium sp. YL32]NDO27464.1 PTS sugar transporter subunit IIC [Enterocloster clostridioformis]OXE69930.1 PTS sugar transporter [Enterocloster clostridioformis]QQR00076.1 PTS sugar transporter subunit IIC [Enterocloster clostridioformis]